MAAASLAALKLGKAVQIFGPWSVIKETTYNRV